MAGTGAVLTNTIGIDDDGLPFDRLDEALGKIVAARRRIDATRSAPYAQDVNHIVLRWWRAELLAITGGRAVAQIGYRSQQIRMFW